MVTKPRVIVFEGPDCLGKTPLVDLTAGYLNRLGVPTKTVVPEPSKQFGKHWGPLHWAREFVEEWRTVPFKGTVLLDRFPFPSEFIYNRKLYRTFWEGNADYTLWENRIAELGWLFVYLRPSPALAATPPKTVTECINGDPMFTHRGVKGWQLVHRRYERWADHTKQLVVEVERDVNTWFDEDTAHYIAVSAGLGVTQ